MDVSRNTKYLCEVRRPGADPELVSRGGGGAHVERPSRPLPTPIPPPPLPSHVPSRPSPPFPILPLPPSLSPPCRPSLPLPSP